jgi:hypothetical protein
MGMTVRSMFGRLAVTTVASVAEQARIRQLSQNFPRLIQSSACPMQVATPVAYPVFHVRDFQYNTIDTGRKVSFVTKPLFENNIALHFEGNALMPGIPKALTNQICLESVIEEEIYQFLLDFTNNQRLVDPNEFITALKRTLRTALIHSKGIYLLHPKFEYVRT